MVRGLVHQQAAGVRDVRVPAAEVVRAVVGVEQILEIHRAHAADRAGDDQLLHLGAERRPAVVERHPHALAGGGHGLEHGAALDGVGGHRLLGDHVAAGMQRTHDVVVMGRILAADEDLVGPLGVQHLVEPVGGVGRHGRQPEALQALVVERHAHAAQVAQADQLVRLRISGDQRFDEADGSSAGADEGVALPALNRHRKSPFPHRGG